MSKILKNFKAFVKMGEDQVKFLSSMQDDLQEEIGKLPDEAQKIYNDNLGEMYKEIKKGNFERVGEVATKSHTRVEKIINKNGR